MNLKQRFSIAFSCLFSLLLAAVMLTVYYLFSEYRRDEFTGRLQDKALTAARIFLEVKEIDTTQQRALDRTSVNRFYKENTEIFDEQRKQVYDTNSDVFIGWKSEDFEQLHEEKNVVEIKGHYDVVGLLYVHKGHDYYVFISAEDTYGNRKLKYLEYLLLGAFVAGTASVWLLSFSLSKKSLQPLDEFRERIQNITDQHLTIRLPDAAKDEIGALARSFNQLMNHIDETYNRQREFTGNASHELRTPVARMTVQLENLLSSGELSPDVAAQIDSIADNAFQLSDIISSLVALADINNKEQKSSFGAIRLDEQLFEAAAELSKLYPDLRLKFDVENETDADTNLEILGDETLIKMVLVNLLKNAYLYSDNHVAECVISQQQEAMVLTVTNTGEAPDPETTGLLFQTFYRGSNTLNKAGSGIGLSVVRRILDYHKASVDFTVLDPQTSRVTVTFSVTK